MRLIEKIKELFSYLINYCDCPFDPDDNPLPQSCDKRTIHTDYCKNECPWRKIPQKEETDIKPCPFCGGSADVKRYGISYPQFYIECDNCHARTDNHVGYDEELAIKHAKRDWNRRCCD